MFDVTTKGELNHLNVRGETHGDETVPAMDIKLTLVNVPVKNITSALENIEKLYTEKDEILIGEANPLTIGHKIENVEAIVGDVKLKGADVKKGISIELLPGKMANVRLSIQIGHAESVAERLMNMLGETVDVKIVERQGRLAAVN